jgi:hypothetical protein
MEQYVADHTEEAKRYLRMTIGGMGNFSGKPSVLVMLLIPISEAGRPIREVTQQIFPVPLMPPVGQIYFHRLVQVVNQGEREETLFRRYLEASGTEILSLRVAAHGDRLVTTLSLRDHQGMIKSFIVRMDDALIQAALNDIPIFVDEEILLNVGSQVSLHFSSVPSPSERESTDDEGTKRAPEGAKSPFELISDFIRDGRTPAEMDREMRSNLSVMVPRQREALGEIALETENYEWAAFLSRTDDKGVTDDE